MDDIKPRRPRNVTPPSPMTVRQAVQGVEPPALAPLPVDPVTVKPPRKPRKKKTLLFVILGLLLLAVLAVAATLTWYAIQLSPVDSKNSTLIKVEIEPNTTPKNIAKYLEDKKVIRSADAFTIYTRLTKTQNNLQAGSYRLSPSSSVEDIVKHLTNGTVDSFNVTFLPGATLAENKQTLIKAGYTAKEVDTAFAATYDSPLFATKPKTSDLEGYIYGETYNFSTDATVKDILTRVFAEFDKVVKENNLVAKFQSHGLTLYQGITLASIVQRESIGGDEPQIAQVFYSRLATSMPLGSDVTYQYIADKTGVPRDTNLDSPYNTRRYTGLPPGPIATAGITSLKAVADPAPGDYLYFLSGDDDVTYYGRTLAEHEANIKAHCKVKCSTL